MMISRIYLFILTSLCASLLVPSGEEGKLNAASPEFIPRSLQGVPSQDPSINAQGTGVEDAGEWPDGRLLQRQV